LAACPTFNGARNVPARSNSDRTGWLRIARRFHRADVLRAEDVPRSVHPAFSGKHLLGDIGLPVES
jgi:hypothetical protein